MRRSEQEARRQHMLAMLAELEGHLESAKAHAVLMGQAVEESPTWSDQEDREWAHKAHADAIADVEHNEQDLANARAIFAEVFPTEDDHAR